MSSNKHPKSRKPSDKDLAHKSGIGATGGLNKRNDDLEQIEGENTVEGDVMNDTTAGGGVNPNQTGRTNK
jgi:hypothetical protein